MAASESGDGCRSVFYYPFTGESRRLFRGILRGCRRYFDSTAGRREPLARLHKAIPFGGTIYQVTHSGGLFHIYYKLTHLLFPIGLDDFDDNRHHFTANLVAAFQMFPGYYWPSRNNGKSNFGETIFFHFRSADWPM